MSKKLIKTLFEYEVPKSNFKNVIGAEQVVILSNDNTSSSVLWVATIIEDMGMGLFIGAINNETYKNWFKMIKPGGRVILVNDVKINRLSIDNSSKDTISEENKQNFIDILNDMNVKFLEVDLITDRADVVDFLKTKES